MIDRVGVDVDGGQLSMLKAYFNAKQIGEVEVRETSRGHHLRIQLPKPVDERRSLEIRASLGDDPKRLDYDYKAVSKGIPVRIDVLFNAKMFRGKIVSLEQPCNPLSLPFKLRVPREVYVCRRCGRRS